MTRSISNSAANHIARNVKAEKMNDEQVERLAAAWEEFEVAAKPTHFDGETEFYSIESMVEAAWEVKKIAEAAMQPDAQAIRNAALREAAAIARDKHEAAITWASVHVKSFDGKTDSLLIAEEIEALLNKENTDER